MIAAMKEFLFAVAEYDSRFGRGPTAYKKDHVDFGWVLFIAIMVMGLCWYTLSNMGKRKKNSGSDYLEDDGDPPAE